MTTTTKVENGKRPAESKVVEGEWADAGQLRGGAERAQWTPSLRFEGFKDDVIAEKLAALPPGSFHDPVVVGVLAVEEAFGEPRYFLRWETKGERNGELIAMPTHGAITYSLDKVILDPAPRVRIEMTGKGTRAKKGQNVPYLYDLRVLPKSAMLTEARDGKDKSHCGYPALAPIHAANKKLRDEAEDE